MNSKTQPTDPMTHAEYLSLRLAIAEDEANHYQGERFEWIYQNRLDETRRWINEARTEDAQRATQQSARGLSRLQRRILVEAYKMRSEYGIPVWTAAHNPFLRSDWGKICTAPDLWPYEVVHRICYIPYSREPFDGRPCPIHPREQSSGRHFSGNTPGLLVAQGSLSRAIKRLAERGLLLPWTFGCVQLSDLGLSVATELTIKESESEAVN